MFVFNYYDHSSGKYIHFYTYLYLLVKILSNAMDLLHNGVYFCVDIGSQKYCNYLLEPPTTKLLIILTKSVD